MQEVKQKFYHILSCYFSGESPSADYSQDAEELRKIAKSSFCLPFFCEVCEKFQISLTEELKNVLMQTVAYHYKNLSVQTGIIRELSKNGIPCAILKGISIAMHYPEPSVRPLGDIDILVSKDDYEKSIDIFTKGEKRNQLSEMHKFHYSFFSSGVCVEIHKGVSDYEEGEQEIKAYMENALQSLTYQETEGFSFPVLLPSYEAISLLIHAKRHYFENNLNLRMLCDWAMFLQKTELSIWRNEIYPLLERFELNRWADALSSVCERFLKLSLAEKIYIHPSEKLVEQLADEFVTDALKRYCDEKNEAYQETRNTSLRDVFFLLNDVARRDFKLAKFPILLPIFWVIIAFRYIYRRKIGFRSKIRIIEHSSVYREKERIFEEINEKRKKI